jgi:DNA-binding winged helix-turn-helix (wHTH) protein/tetratricopeptide (TPR) repeat protein
MSKLAVSFYEFGPFHLDAVKRLLLREGEAVALTPKAFDLLLALVESSERVLEKSELIERVWPDSFVEESNLTQNISTLRKALRESPHHHQYIVTVPGRGYRFVASVNEVCDAGDELILERQTRSRIVMEREEEIRLQEETEAVNQKAIEVSGPKPSQTGWRLSPKLLAIGLVVIGLAIAFSTLLIPSKPKPEVTDQELRVIAVLPFKPMGEEGSEEYLRLGMADALITKLSNVRQIIVRPTSAVIKYGNSDQDPAAIGRELKVNSLLDGRIQRIGDRVRVTVQLLRVRDGTPLWAYKCDEQCADIFEVQDTISEKVAAALALKLTGEERQRLAKRYTENIEAYQLYLKGRYFWNKRTADGLQKAIAYFGQAIEKDPAYALAYVGLADSYSLLSYFGGLPSNETFPKAKAALQKALEIDDELPEAHASLGLISAWFDWNWSGAEREYQRAVELNQNYATVHHWYGNYLTLIGRQDEGVAELKRAWENDPLSLIINTDLGWALSYARRYDQAIEQLSKTLEMDPNFAHAHIMLAQTYEGNGEFKKAIAEYQKAVELSGGSGEYFGTLGYVYAVSGRRDEAQKLLDGLKKQKYVRPYRVAVIYAGLGEKEPAFEWLDKAYRARDEGVIGLKVDPKLDSLRSEPRFLDLLQRMGFVH